MAQAAQRTPIDPALFATFPEATRRYRMADPTMTNAQVAEHLQLVHALGDHMGAPNCCFFHPEMACALVAIRTKQDEISIFHMFQMYQRRMERIGERILDEQPKG